MKKLKQLMAMMLTAVMILSMAVTGFAAGTGSLTINLKGGTTNNSEKGLTVNLYKLFDVSGTTDNYTYTVNRDYESALKEILSLDGPATSEQIHKKIYDLNGDNTKVEKFAKDLNKKLLESNLAVTTTATIKENENSVTVNGLDIGYYLVYLPSSEGTQASLVNFLGEDKEVNLKEKAPGIDKTLEDGSSEETVSIGDIITYKITTTIPNIAGLNNGDYKYIITDKLSDGIDFVNWNETAPAIGPNLNISFQLAEETPDTDGTIDGVTTVIGPKVELGTDKRKLTIDLSNYIKAHQGEHIGKTITIKYQAKVNANAVVTEKNSASLEYSNTPNTTVTTKPDEVKTPTFPIHINKTDVNGNPLAGAKFEIYGSKSNEPNTMGDTAIKVEASTPAGVYKVSENQTTGSNTEMTTVESISGENYGILGGYNLVINGLKAGNYWLKEVAAPEGYNLLKNPIKITIKNNGDTTYTITEESDDATVSDNIITIINKTGGGLPGTGGMGTVLFTVIGAALIIMAGIRLARRNSEQE